MASTSLLLFFLFISIFQISTSLLLPITKHPLTNQYLAQIRLGSEPVPATLVVDLSNPSLWVVDCSSSSKTPVPSLSIPCSATSDPTPPSSPSTCTVLSNNPFSNLSGRGELVFDSISLKFLENPTQIGSIGDFLFICAPKFLSHGLPDGARGVFGLGRSSRISPFSQLAHQFNLPGKFSVCLPGKHGEGLILAGKSPESLTQVTKSLVYTPLLETGSGSDEYNILVKSIKINSKKLSLSRSNFRAKLSTVDPLTKMGSEIYQTFLKAFEIAGDALNMKRAETREPFGLCYRADESKKVVPGVDLVLQSEMVKWRINGRNSMVEMDDGVMCLGFVDGGSDLDVGEIVIGAHQLEDVFMEFDLRNGMLGFSSSLLDKETSCSALTLDAAARSRDF